MQQQTRIAPSILSADFSCLGEEVRAMEAAGADALHIDIMDGHFVPNLTIGPDVVTALRPLVQTPFDVHLMIAPAEPFVDAFVKAGADTITFHPEADWHPHRTVQQIKAQGKRAGLALNPGTPASAVEALLGDVDLVLAMTVNPGFGGQKFIGSVLDKLAILRRMIDASGRAIDLQVDGGINAETAPRAVAAGADFLVAGTAGFAGGPPAYALAPDIRASLVDADRKHCSDRLLTAGIWSTDPSRSAISPKGCAPSPSAARSIP